MSDHARLMPSAAHRWGGKQPCAGSVAMEAAIPQEESEESREGDAAHWVCQMLLTADFLIDEGAQAPNGVAVTGEMRVGAELYAEYIRRVLGRNPQHVEQRTAGGGIHPECWGTPDADDFGDTGLHVFDYKFGHRFVEVFENEQLLCYTADLLKHLGGLQDQLTPVTFHIIQPRSFHRDGPIRTWSCKASDLRPHFNRLAAAAADALVPGARTLATPSNCRDCRARTSCDAAQAAGLEAAAVAGTSVPFDLEPAEAGRYLALVKYAQGQLTAMETGLEEQLSQALRSGKRVVGWQLQRGSTREKWTAKPGEVLALGAALGVDLAVPCTPAQARAKGIDGSVISGYSERPEGAMKLVPTDLTHFKKVFLP